MLKDIKCIIFDIGGVLVDLDFERCIASFKALGFEGAENLVSCYHPQEFFGELERGEITSEVFYDKIRETAKIDLSNEEIFTAYTSLLEGIPVEKLRMIEKLRTKGYKILALSNINEVMIEPIYEFMKGDGHDASFYFDKMYLSYEMGVMKPDPKIYQLLIDDSGIDPSETLFIDDGEKNVIAARELGFQVYFASAREDFSHIFEE